MANLLSRFVLRSYSILILQLRTFSVTNKSERRFMMKEYGKFSPPVNRAMRHLDRSFFQKDIPLLMAVFPNPKHISDFVKLCKNDVLLMPGVKYIVPIHKTKGVLLRDDIDNLKTYKNLLSSTALEKLNQSEAEVLPYNLHLDYSFWKADDILRAVLPEHLLHEAPTGYSQAGHIAHFNLRKEFKEYGGLIGQLILDKNPNIRTVVDKIDTIDTKFRTFKMNILAGKDDFIVEQSESGCKFRFDFSSVYWNLRLSTEHDRIITQFQPSEAVADVFAGVGPFAIPAGRKNALVLANDLNPESHKYLKENISLNKVDAFVRAYNMDGRDFIKKSPSLILQWAMSQGKIERKVMIKRRKTNESTNESRTVRSFEVSNIEIPKYISTYVMNLPDSAITFLDEFIGLYSRDKEVETMVKNDPNFKLPTINVHCFEKFSAEEPEPPIEELHRRIHTRIVQIIQHPAPLEQFSFHLVRKVAPTKPMFCVTFQLPKEVAFRTSK